jgi:hypothetical protein
MGKLWNRGWHDMMANIINGGIILDGISVLGETEVRAFIFLPAIYCFNFPALFCHRFFTVVP